uniref:Uncharacterized protein n=1 Tax=Guillardia theta TaxID=55529 RepID=A0A7S4P592_GUITH|mmetsp:Transcript_43326/g.136974  ORF Transcript_43326/g.136974 Transcript_43326/m.136974 type:complete len:264 (+) Transcript_43326:259-1050(+)
MLAARSRRRRNLQAHSSARLPLLSPCMIMMFRVEEGAEKGGGKDGLSVHEEKRARRLNLPFGSSPRNFQRRQNLGADKTTLRLPTINVTVPKNNEGRRDSNGVLLDEGSKDQLFSRDFRRGKSKIATAPDGMKNALSHGPPPVLVKLMQETSRLPMQQLPPLQRSMRGHSAGDEGSLASSVFGNEPVHESHKPLTKYLSSSYKPSLSLLPSPSFPLPPSLSLLPSPSFPFDCQSHSTTDLHTSRGRLRSTMCLLIGSHEVVCK